MDGKKYKLTKEKVESLKQELERLKKDERTRIADTLDRLRDETLDEMDTSIGDVLEEKDSLERKILEIKEMLSNHEVVKHPKNDKVAIGSTVVLEDGSRKLEYEIVSSVEADPLEGKISEESPLGVALMGKKKGEKVSVENEDVKKSYKILSIK